MDNLKNYYTAASDQEALTIKRIKEIVNEIPEEFLEHEVVIVAQLGQELRGIPISNVILDVEGKQLALFNFVLRNKLRMDAMNSQSQNNDQPNQAEETSGNS